MYVLHYIQHLLEPFNGIFVIYTRQTSNIKLSIDSAYNIRIGIGLYTHIDAYIVCFFYWNEKFEFGIVNMLPN